MAVLTKAYGGRAIITFNEAKHYYTVTVPGVCEKLLQPSVTGIIGKLDKSGALVPWAVGQMSERVKELLGSHKTLDSDSMLAIVDVAQDTWRKSKQEAADIGTLAHRVLEQKLLGENPKLPLTADDLLAPHLTPEMVEKANNSVNAGLQFLDEHHVEVVQAEAVRWSPTYGYVGTCDLVARVDGKLSVLDWKTSKRLYDTVFLQLAAYQSAYEEEFPGQKVEQRIGVNIGRDGELTIATRDNATYAQDLKTFLALLDVWRWDKENSGAWSKPAPRQLTEQNLQYVLAR